MYKVIPLLMNGSTEKITSDTFSSRLQELMKDAGLTQKGLADRLGMSQAVVSNWKRGDIPTNKNLKEIAKVLGVTAEWLRTGRGAPRVNTSSESEMVLRDEPSHTPTKERCMRYLQAFLATCDSADRLGWTLIELKERFPLDKWRRGLSSTSVSEVEEQSVRAAETEYERARREREPSPKAHEPSGEKSEPYVGTLPGTIGPHPWPPKRAPK